MRARRGATFVMLAPEHPLVEKFAAESKDPAAFRAAAARFGDAEALVDGDLRLSFNQLSERVTEWARAFLAVVVLSVRGVMTSAVLLGGAFVALLVVGLAIAFGAAAAPVVEPEARPSIDWTRSASTGPSLVAIA